jgi:hypothetical protein
MPSSSLPRVASRVLVALSLIVAHNQGLQAQAGVPDRDGVRRAVLDYVEGFYEGDTTRLVRSVRPEVHKYGFYLPKDSRVYTGEGMPFTEFLSYARNVKARGQAPKPEWPKRIDVFDVADQTASAKLTAWWGIDYLLLAKYDGKWMITHVLWQSPPKETAAKP